ncbi:MAG: hypothetical protein BGO78_08115 [Chloroflexi bacterium 44-23]|nr:MAG: hypothetical protein BGO78_08115 [Chloroflexi bacterium 44-23]
MNRISIDIEKWQIKPHDLWDNQWLLLTSGDFSSGEFNCMTVGWGSFGTMWNKPFAMVVVRPQRYTYQFMEKYPDFSLCAFQGEDQPALSLLGKKSGRDGNKIKLAGLTPIASSQIQAPIFQEAILAIECKKTYWHDFNPQHFLAGEIHSKYPLKDYHRVYFGEILTINATEAFNG